MRVVFSEGFFTNRQGFLLYVTNLIEETSPPRIACHRQARHSLISPCVFSFLIYAYPRIFGLPQQETNPIGGAQSLISITLASGSKMKICENEDLYDPRGDLHTPKFEEFYVLLFRRFFGLTECILTNFIVISREEERNLEIKKSAENSNSDSLRSFFVSVGDFYDLLDILSLKIPIFGILILKLAKLSIFLPLLFNSDIFSSPTSHTHTPSRV